MVGGPDGISRHDHHGSLSGQASPAATASAGLS
jgi:hypothetical protein